MQTRMGILWHRAYSLCAERYLGIRTRGLERPPNAEGVHYTPLPYPLVFRMLRELGPGPEDVFVDVGCGKGRVVCCAARARMKKVIALELNPALLGQAVRNAAAVRGRRTVVVAVEQSAETYNYEDATVVYLYNPFNARLTGMVLEQLRQSASRRPRTVRVVYANPVHESTVVQHGWLKKYEEWPASEYPVFGYAVSFWRADPP
jgi:SAM-dependent methyltransferase